MCLLHIIDFESRFADHGQVKFSASSFDQPFKFRLYTYIYIYKPDGKRILENELFQLVF